MRTKLLAVGLAAAGLLSAAIAAIAVWRRMGADAVPPASPIVPPRRDEPASVAPRSPVSSPPVASAPVDPPPDRIAHNGLFAALGRATYRWRRWLPIAGLAVVIGLNVWASTGAGRLSQGGWQVAGSEAARAEALLAARFGEQLSSIIVLFTDPAGDAGSDAFQATVADAVAPLAGEPLVDEIVTYADIGDPALLSEDGRRTFALVRLTEEMEDAVDDVEHLVGLIDEPDGVETIVTGIPVIQHEFNEAVERDLLQAEMISLPIALLILLAVFGTVVGAALPLVIAGMALPTSIAVIGLLANVTEMSIFVTNVTTMIGLALSIDYALFMVSRFREELRHRSVADAVEHTMATVGKAVAISGVAVAIGLASLTVFESPALRSMGLGGIITVVSTLVFGLTVLPALLGMLGPRVNRLRVPLPRSLRLIEDDAVAADARHGHGVWSRIARRVMRRPLLVATPVLLVLVLAGLPFFGIQLSTGGNLDDLPPSESVTGFRIIADDFPGGGSDPIEVAVRTDGPVLTDGAVDPALIADLEGYVADLRDVEGVDDVTSLLDPPPGMDEATYRQLITLPEAQRPAETAGLAPWLERTTADDVTRVDVFSPRLPDSADGRALVDAVRAVPGPVSAEEVLTAGLSSRSRDFMASFAHSVPYAVAIVVGVTGAVLFLTFGSIFLPLKAVLMSLLSITASFGALVWIFQDGHLAGPLGFDPSGTIIASTPILMFAILFGLSMDYEVLLLSRIRERYLATGDNTRAVAEGIGITGGIITGAALIMVAVFGAFALSSVTLIKALGFSMALAVLIDATIVRGILVPAFMRVMGRVNWWAPAWIQRLVSRLGLYEGAADAPPARAEPASGPA
ncbi:MAG TPA: MMPL family transporter [Candidatus Limnocylindria bacterium]|nr:MMPL family transporter [Candidatus Limnocylindria bacterium]